MKYFENGKTYNMASGLNDFQKKLYMHLIDWKSAHLTEKPGYYKGHPYDYMFPEEYIQQNPLPPFIYSEVHDEIKEMQNSRFAYKVHKMAYHMASSQTACINLFMPLLLDENADEIIGNLPGAPSDFRKINRNRLFKGFCFEYWGQDFTSGKGLLGDHSNAAGTDSDLAIAYINDKDEECLWLIEHKLTEKEFTTCGAYKSDGNTDRTSCKTYGLQEIMTEPCRCHYHRIGYKYWDVMESWADTFKTNQHLHQCPFKGGMNQLWRNHLLAFVYTDSGQYKHVYFSVVHHRDNDSLTDTMNEYRSLITPKITMTSFTNADILNIAEKKSKTLTAWVQWYRNLYNL